MASLQSSSSSSSCMPKLPSSRKGVIKAAILDFKTSKPTKSSKVSLQNLQVGEIARGFTSLIEKQQTAEISKSEASMAMQKMYAIMEIVADRVEMHKNIGEQRENWNSLLLNSINAITLSATTMSAIASAINVDALKLSSTLMFLAATGILVIMNKIQPSQLAEEQRNAARLFRQLQNQIQTNISIGNPTETDVKVSMEKILALDKAYPLPLLGVMLEKFPSQVEPAQWWPEKQTSSSPRQNTGNNGWNSDLEKEMKSVMEVVGKRDQEDYVRLGGKALKLNKMLAVAGPVLTAMAAVGSAASLACGAGSWAAMVCGGLSSVVNSLEHGGQVGMVFEMYRSNAGFFNLMQESIKTELRIEPGRRENGELFEIKTALQLGRSLSDLRKFASSSSSSACDHHEEFASKLF